MGALHYNLRKLNHPDSTRRATLLETNFSSMDLKQIRQEVNLVRELRPNLDKYVYHTSLNLPKDENLTDDVLLQIAYQYMDAMGFTNNQFFIFRHHDAGHPHLHLLVNRITFDGGVVSDSNNYRRSEQALRNIERQYNLAVVTGSKHSALRAPTKDELEMAVRSGKPSEKMLLQEIVSAVLKQRTLNMQDFIRECESKGVYFLFNLQSTGRISGISYCTDGMVIKGQKLGNRFKWSELLKKLDYEQDRDGKAVSEANGRTREKYARFDATSGQRVATGSDGLHWGAGKNIADEYKQRAENGGTGNETYPNRARSLDTDQDDHDRYRDTAHDMYPDTLHIDISIADDMDDEAIYGKDRRRQRKAREYSR